MTPSDTSPHYWELDHGDGIGLQGQHLVWVGSWDREFQHLINGDGGGRPLRVQRESLRSLLVNGDLAVIDSHAHRPREVNLYDWLKRSIQLRPQAKSKANNPQSPSQKLEALLRKFSLYDLRAQKLATLSPEHFRKAQLLRALLGSPEYLVLRDPFLGLDLNTTALLEELFDENLSEKKCLWFFSSPDDVPQAWSLKNSIPMLLQDISGRLQFPSPNPPRQIELAITGNPQSLMEKLNSHGLRSTLTGNECALPHGSTGQSTNILSVDGSLSENLHTILALIEENGACLLSLNEKCVSA